MLTGQYDKLAKANMKKAKIEKKKVGENEPYTQVDYEMMLIKKHIMKSNEVRLAYETDYFNV